MRQASSDRKVNHGMSEHRIGTVLAAVGALLSLAGAISYVLPGPGFPVLVTGLVVLTTGLVMTVARRSTAALRGKAMMSVIRQPVPRRARSDHRPCAPGPALPVRSIPPARAGAAGLLHGRDRRSRRPGRHRMRDRGGAMGP